MGCKTPLSPAIVSAIVSVVTEREKAISRAQEVIVSVGE
jgi:hypothetical protein